METQNAVSRRRIRELEMELEACKENVKREKTRLLEEEQASAIRHADASTSADFTGARQSKGKGKTGSVDVQIDQRQRYRLVVEEKKGVLNNFL